MQPSGGGSGLRAAVRALLLQLATAWGWVGANWDPLSNLRGKAGGLFGYLSQVAPASKKGPHSWLLAAAAPTAVQKRGSFSHQRPPGRQLICRVRYAICAFPYQYAVRGFEQGLSAILINQQIVNPVFALEETRHSGSPLLGHYLSRGRGKRFQQPVAAELSYAQTSLCFRPSLANHYLQHTSPPNTLWRKTRRLVFSKVEGVFGVHVCAQGDVVLGFINP